MSDRCLVSGFSLVCRQHNHAKPPFFDGGDGGEVRNGLSLGLSLLTKSVAGTFYNKHLEVALLFQTELDSEAFLE